MIFDAVVLVVIFISALIAFFRGLIREVLTIFGVVGGAVAAIYLGPVVSPMIRNWVTPDLVENQEPQKFFNIIPFPLLGDIIGYGSVFVVFVILLSVISHFLSAWVKSIGLGFADRLLGVVFGLIRGVLLVAIFWLPVFLLVDQEDRKKWGWVENSFTVSYVEIFVGYLEKFLPQDTEKKLEETVENATEKAEMTLQEMNKSRANDSKDTEASVDGYEENNRNVMDDLVEDTIEGLPKDSLND